MTLTETEKLTATLATQLLVGYMSLLIERGFSTAGAHMSLCVAEAKEIIELSREPKPKTRPTKGIRIRQWPSDK